MSDRKPSEIAWSNVPDSAVFPSFASYEVLRDTIIAAFNPGDDDAAEEAVIGDAVDRAWAYIVARPCTCPVAAMDYDADPCDRCDALGRRCDSPEER